MRNERNSLDLFGFSFSFSMTNAGCRIEIANRADDEAFKQSKGNRVKSTENFVVFSSTMFSFSFRRCTSNLWITFFKQFEVKIKRKFSSFFIDFKTIVFFIYLARLQSLAAQQQQQQQQQNTSTTTNLVRPAQPTNNPHYRYITPTGTTTTTRMVTPQVQQPQQPMNRLNQRNKKTHRKFLLKTFFSFAAMSFPSATSNISTMNSTQNFSPTTSINSTNINEYSSFQNRFPTATQNHSLRPRTATSTTNSSQSKSSKENHNDLSFV